MMEEAAERQRAIALTGWAMTLALAVFRLFPAIVQPGMFFDGVAYATIARNMAAGVGSFWHPAFSSGAGADFHEQPPLAFWLESLWFRAFGDHYWVEKCYSATTAILTGIVIIAIWRRLSRSLLPEGTSAREVPSGRRDLTCSKTRSGYSPRWPFTPCCGRTISAGAALAGPVSPPPRHWRRS
jgi:hypothetical protein